MDESPENHATSVVDEAAAGHGRVARVDPAMWPGPVPVGWPGN